MENGITDLSAGHHKIRTSGGAPTRLNSGKLATMSQRADPPSSTQLTRVNYPSGNNTLDLASAVAHQMQRSIFNGNSRELPTLQQFPSDPFSLQARVNYPSGGANPLDLTSAITHQLQRPSTKQQELLAWQQQLEATHMYMSHDRAPDFTPAMVPSGSINDLRSPGMILPNYIPHFDDNSMELARVGGSRELHSQPLPVTSLDRADSSQRRFTRDHDVALPGAALDVGRRTMYHDQQPIWMPAQVTDIQGMHNGRSMGSWGHGVHEQQSRLGYGACEAPAGVQPGQQTDTTGASCVMSVTGGELSSTHMSGDNMPRSSQRPAQSCSLIGGQLCAQDVALDAELCTDDDDLESVLIDDKRKKRMLSNRASAQRSRQRRQERLDQLEVLTAQLRVENATLVRKEKLSTQLAKTLEEENKQLQAKFQKLQWVLDKVGGSKLLKQLAHVLDSEDCTSSRQISVAHVVQRKSPSPNRKQQETHEDDRDYPLRGSGNKRGTVPSGDSSGERQEVGRSDDSGHRSHSGDSNFQPSTRGKQVSSVQPNDHHVSDIAGSSSGRSRKRPFSNGRLTKTYTKCLTHESIDTPSDSQMEQNGSEIYDDSDIFSQFDSMAQMFLPDHLHSGSHMPSSRGVQSFESGFDTAEDDKWLESFADSLHS